MGKKEAVEQRPPTSPAADAAPPIPDQTDEVSLKDRIFTFETIKQLREQCKTPQDCISFFGDILGLKEYSTRARHSFVLDYFNGIKQFVTENNLKVEQELVVFNIGKDLLSSLLDGRSFKESENFFKAKMLTLNENQPEQNPDMVFNLSDIREVVNFFVFTFFQHYRLYKHCFTKEQYTEKRSQTVCVETLLVPPLSEALSEAELEAQRTAAKELFKEAEEAEKEAAEKAKAERKAAEEARLAEDRKKKPQNLDEAIEFIIREKLEDFKKSFFEGCASEQKRLFDKLGELEAFSSHDGKVKKRPSVISSEKRASIVSPEPKK